MPIRFNVATLQDGFERLRVRLASIAQIGLDAGPLMERWERVIEQDNREGVLAGTDKDGNPAPALKYRPVTSLRAKATGKAPKLTVSQRLGQRGNVRRGKYAGFGPAASGLHNNLSGGEYRKLDGPRLAPRRQFSRVITNLVTGHGRDPDDPNTWYAEGVWQDVVDRKGRSFLGYHFEGSSKLPKYDLRGVRPGGIALLLESLREWAKLQIRERWNRAG